MASQNQPEISLETAQHNLTKIIADNPKEFGFLGITDVVSLLHRLRSENDFLRDIQDHLGFHLKKDIEKYCFIITAAPREEVPTFPDFQHAPDSASVHYLASALLKLRRNEMSMLEILQFLSDSSLLHRIDSVQMAGPCHSLLRVNDTVLNLPSPDSLPASSSTHRSSGYVWYALSKTSHALIICFVLDEPSSAVQFLSSIFQNLPFLDETDPQHPTCIPIVLCQLIEDEIYFSPHEISLLLLQNLQQSLPPSYSNPNAPLILPCHWQANRASDVGDRLRPFPCRVMQEHIIPTVITVDQIFIRVTRSELNLEATVTVNGAFLINIKALTLTGDHFLNSSWQLVQQTNSILQLTARVASFENLNQTTFFFDCFDFNSTGPHRPPAQNVFLLDTSLGYMLTDCVDNSLLTRAVFLFTNQLYEMKKRIPNLETLQDESLPLLFTTFVRAFQIAAGRGSLRSDILRCVHESTELTALLTEVEECTDIARQRILRFANQWPRLSQTWGTHMFGISRMILKESEGVFLFFKPFYYAGALYFFAISPFLAVASPIATEIAILVRGYPSGYSRLLTLLLILQLRESHTLGTDIILSSIEYLLSTKVLGNPGSLSQAKLLFSLIHNNSSKLHLPFQLSTYTAGSIEFSSATRLQSSLDMIDCISTIQDQLLRFIQVVVLGFQDAGKTSLLEGMFRLELGSSGTVSTTSISTVHEYIIGPCNISIADTPGLNDLTEIVRKTANDVLGRASIYLLVISVAELERPNADHVQSVKRLFGCTSPNFILVYLTKLDFQPRTLDGLQCLISRFSNELGIPEENFCLTSMFHKASAADHRECMKLGVCDGNKAQRWLLCQLSRFGLIPQNVIDELLRSSIPAASIPSPSASTSSSHEPATSSSSSPPTPPYDLPPRLRSQIETAKVGETIFVEFPHPFSPEPIALTSLKVLKIFTDGVSQPQLLELSDQTLVLYKKSDDLRLDRFVLAMMEHFNSCWKRENLLFKWHNDPDHGSLIRNVIYQVQPFGTKGGFIQFVENSQSVLPLYNRSLLGGSRNYNEWKFDTDGHLLATSVGSFLSLFILNVGDTHQSNMLLTEHNELVAIDFAFLHESPAVDTSYFPIPIGLKELFKTQRQWESFKSTCWKALQTLRKHSDELLTACDTAARMVDPRLLNQAPAHLQSFLNYPKDDLFTLIESGSRNAIPKNLLQIIKSK